MGDEVAVPDLSTESELTRVAVIRLDALLIGEGEADEEAHVVPLGVPFIDTVDDGVPLWLTEVVGFVVNEFSAAVPVTEVVGVEDSERAIVREPLALTQKLADIVIVTEVVKDVLIVFVAEVEAEPKTECDTLATLALNPGDSEEMMLSDGERVI